MKTVAVIFRRSKKINIVIAEFRSDKFADPQKEAIKFIRDYDGKHKRENLIIRETTNIINPFRKILTRKKKAA